MLGHAPSPAPQPGRVTARSILLGLILIPVCQYWIFQVEMVRYTFPTLVSPFYNAIFILAVLALWNAGVYGLARVVGSRGGEVVSLRGGVTTPPPHHPTTSRGLRRLALSQVELLVIYTMVSVASALSSSDMLGILVSEMGHAERFATAENRWQTLFASRLPNWLVVRDPEALKGYYEGHSSLWTVAHLRVWLRPIFWWSIFATALAVLLLLVCVILRKQWIERERLTYPIIFLPLEMTQVSGPQSFYRHPLLWAGFAVASGITLLNGFHHLFPAVPGLPIKRFNVGQYLVNSPWNGISFLQRMFYLFGIGIAFLMPLDLSVSCWVFYLLYLAERILFRATGMDQGEFPYYRDQSWGAYLGLFLLVLWASRGYWQQVVRTAFRLTPPLRKEGVEGVSPFFLDESPEPIGYRWAMLGLVLCSAILMVFVLKIGMAWVWALLFFFLYLCVAVMIARLRAEIGMPVHDMQGANVHTVLTTTLGTGLFSIRDLTSLSLLHWMNRVYRSHPIPHQLESLKLAERTGTHSRGFFMAVLLAIMLTVPCVFLIYLHGYYQLGAETSKVERWALGFGREYCEQLANWIDLPTDPDLSRLGAGGVGCAVALTIAALRRRFPGFILHPLGFAIASGWGMHNLWLCILIGSVTKWLVLRYGGLKLYRRWIPFFLGLILGEYIIGSLWSFVGIALGIRTYDFWP